ncbi:aminotransferase class V-fold PLP-dependent enzyme [Shewanella waksmanii]|uniref:aminotransferase class V-fold PLP-dependent enzyme n=1 Tax=Shewanella waksmanii TaxID=213783 RepID=UPI0037367885
MNQANIQSQIYLDANATTPVLPQAANAVVAAMQELFGNPSSSHITGLKAKHLMEQTRQKGQQLLGSGEGKLIFTSGATEGIQTAILSALVAAKQTMQTDKNYCLLYGATEHKAVPNSLAHWNSLLQINADIKAIPVDSRGNLDHDFIAQHAPSALMICTMAVNNETGVYQDLEALDNCIRQHNPNTFWMVDCVQALGKRPLNLADTSIDYAPFSGHKLYAPKGIGFVYIRDKAPFTPFIAGGGQEGGLRSGTENLPGLAALDVIFDMLLHPEGSPFASLEKLNDFRQQLATSLAQAFPSIVFNHDFNNSVATTLNFAIPGFSSKEIMDLFDAAHIRVSSGSACSSKVTRSFVLDAMGLPAWQSESAIRLSFGPAMTQDEVDQACERIQIAANALGHSCLRQSQTTINDKAPLEGLVELRSGANCCWIYADQNSQQAVVIDAVPELVDRIDTLLQCQQLKPVAIVDTHGHADHESGRSKLAKLYLQHQDSDHLGWPTDHGKAVLNNSELDAISLGSLQLIKVATPGHTADSVTYLLINAQQHIHFAFCGDTVLMGSLGRTNFASSSAELMYHSLQHLHGLIGDDTLLCASHDYHNEFTTSFKAEIQRNSLLMSVLTHSISCDDFVARKQQLDAHLADEVGETIMCGAYTQDCQKLAITEYTSQSLRQVLSQPHDLKIVDIREPHEYALQHELADIDSCELNIPLTRLVQFIEQNNDKKQQQWVLVCRSGSRSLIAAQAMHRLGFDQVAHLKGGYALSA